MKRKIDATEIFGAKTSSSCASSSSSENFIELVEVCKAEPVGSTKKVEDILIHIGLKLPGLHMDLKEIMKFYDEEAQKIADALFDHLPQGTMDRVLYKIMERKVKDSGYMGLTGR